MQKRSVHGTDVVERPDRFRPSGLAAESPAHAIIIIVHLASFLVVALFLCLPSAAHAVDLKSIFDKASQTFEENVGSKVEETFDKVFGEEDEPDATQSQPPASSQPQGSQQPPPSPGPPYPAAEVRETQRLLTELGYEPGPIDGVYGSKTLSAILAFETDRGLPPTGVPSQEIIGHLRTAAAGGPQPSDTLTTTAPEPSRSTPTAAEAGGGPSITTEKQRYGPGEPIVVSYRNFPQGQQAILVLEPEGAPERTYYEHGAAHTSRQRMGHWRLPQGKEPGRWEVRAYLLGPDQSRTLLTRQVFEVGAIRETATLDRSKPVLSTDRTQYLPHEPIVVTYRDFPADQLGMLALVPENAGPGTTGAGSDYIKGASAGQYKFKGAPGPGRYEVRAYAVAPDSGKELLARHAVVIANQHASRPVPFSDFVSAIGLPGVYGIAGFDALMEFCMATRDPAFRDETALLAERGLSAKQAGMAMNRYDEQFAWWQAKLQERGSSSADPCSEASLSRAQSGANVIWVSKAAAIGHQKFVRTAASSGGGQASAEPPRPAAAATEAVAAAPKPVARAEPTADTSGDVAIVSQTHVSPLDQDSHTVWTVGLSEERGQAHMGSQWRWAGPGPLAEVGLMIAIDPEAFVMTTPALVPDVVESYMAHGGGNAQDLHAFVSRGGAWQRIDLASLAPEQFGMAPVRTEAPERPAQPSREPVAGGRGGHGEARPAATTTGAAPGVVAVQVTTAPSGTPQLELAGVRLGMTALEAKGALERHGYSLREGDRKTFERGMNNTPSAFYRQTADATHQVSLRYDYGSPADRRSRSSDAEFPVNEVTALSYGITIDPNENFDAIVSVLGQPDDCVIRDAGSRRPRYRCTWTSFSDSESLLAQLEGNKYFIQLKQEQRARVEAPARTETARRQETPRESEAGIPVAALEAADAVQGDRLLEQPEPESAAPPEGPYGPDMVGAQLGMKLDEAEAIIRDHMNVGWVYEMRRDVEAPIEMRPYQAMRVYISSDLSDLIGLYTEPPEAGDTVVAMVRERALIADTAREDVEALLRDKYGEPDVAGPGSVQAWGATAPAVACSPSPANSRSGLALLEGQDPRRLDDRELQRKLMQRVRSVPRLMSTNPGVPPVIDRWVTCGPVLSARLNLGAIQLFLVDHSAYGHYYRASFASIRDDGSAGTAAENEPPEHDLKF